MNGSLDNISNLIKYFYFQLNSVTIQFLSPIRQLVHMLHNKLSIFCFFFLVGLKQCYIEAFTLCYLPGIVVTLNNNDLLFFIILCVGWAQLGVSSVLVDISSWY